MTRFQRILAVAACIAATLDPLFAAGGSRVEPTTAAAEPSPERQAAELYNDGLASRDQALELEDKAADPALSAEKRQKIQNKAARAWEQAISSFTRAVETNPRMHQAWSALGHARRQTGAYETALEAYGQALALEPDYGEALEYLGEAYLGLNRVEDAQQTYERLQSKDKKLAGELLSAMSAWIEQRRSEPDGAKVGELDTFERWVTERLAGAPVVDSSLRKPRTW